MKNLLIVVSAPSGAGKTTLCERLMAAQPSIAYSVSCTTRAPRGGEVNGRHYHFLDEATFERYAAEGRFLEHARVHGHRYGTLRSTVEQALGAGRDVLLDIDVQGARQIRAALARLPANHPLRLGFVDIFIAPPSLAALRRRLETRAEDSPRAIAERLRNAESELACAGEYQYRVVNDRLDDALARLVRILAAERRDDE